MADHFQEMNKKTVYGPVRSWRYGMSLGIDPIFTTSTCSFNCVYCQLGNIQNITTDYREYVPVKQVLTDFQRFDLETFEVITFSGSGEPTLASNLGSMIKELRNLAPDKKQIVLTNGTMLNNSQVVADCQLLDTVIVKLDATSEEELQKVNRPASGISLRKIVESASSFRAVYSGELEIQCMLMPMNDSELNRLADLFLQIGPDIVQLNTPKRAYPLSWHRENRGNHEEIFSYDVRRLKTIDQERAKEIESHLKKKTGLRFQTFYDKTII